MSRSQRYAALAHAGPPDPDDRQRFPALGSDSTAAAEEVYNDTDDQTLDASQGVVVEWQPSNARVVRFIRDMSAVAQRVADNTADRGDIVLFMTELARFAPHIASVADIPELRDEILRVVHTAMSAQFATEHAGQQVFVEEVSRTLNEQGALVLFHMNEAAHQRDEQDNALLGMVNSLQSVVNERSEHTAAVLEILDRRQAADAGNLRQLIVDRANAINATVENALAEVAAVRADASAAVQWQHANIDARLASQRDSFTVLLRDAETRAVQLGQSAADAAATRAAALAITTATAHSRAEADAARQHADSQLTAYAASSAAERQSDAAAIRGEMQRVSAEHMSRALEIAAMASRAVYAEVDARLHAARVEDDARVNAAHREHEARTTREITKLRADQAADMITVRATFAQMQSEVFADAVEQSTATIQTTSAAHIKATDAIAKQTRDLISNINKIGVEVSTMQRDIARLNELTDGKTDKCNELAQRFAAVEKSLGSIAGQVRRLENSGRDGRRDFNELAASVDALQKLVGARFDELDKAGAASFVSLARTMSCAPERDDDGGAPAGTPAKRITTTWGPPPPRGAPTDPLPDVDDDSDVEAYPQRQPRGTAYPATAQLFSQTYVRQEARATCGTAPPGAGRMPDGTSPAPKPPANAPHYRNAPQPQRQHQNGAPQHTDPPLPHHHHNPHHHCGCQSAQPPPAQPYAPPIQAFVQQAPKPDIQISSVVADTPYESAKYLNRERAVELRDAIGLSVTNLPNVSKRDGRTVTGFLLLSVGVFHLAPGLWRERLEEAFLDATGTEISSVDLARFTQLFEFLCIQVSSALIKGLTPEALCSTAEHADPYTRASLGIAPVFDENNDATRYVVKYFHELRRDLTAALFVTLTVNEVNAAKLNTSLDGAIAKSRLSPPTSAKSFNPIVEARALYLARGGQPGGARSGNTPPAAPRPPSSRKHPAKQPAAAPATPGAQSKTTQQPAQQAQAARAGAGPGGGQQ
jgi:hypothetical protein